VYRGTVFVKFILLHAKCCPIPNMFRHRYWVALPFERMPSVVSAPALVITRALNPGQTHACRPWNGREY